MSTTKERKLLDAVRDVMRLRHYSIHTERSYCEWIRKFVIFHGMKSREDLVGGEKKIEAFLTHLAVQGKVASATQNQAMNALVFLYKKVLNHDLSEAINAIRAHRKINVPEVMTRQETAKVLSLMSGTAQLIAKLLYGSGLRMSEAIRLRVQDINFELKAVTIRSGKGDKDRVSTFPESLVPFFKNHLKKVWELHQSDLAQGAGEVYLPHALTRKYRNAAKEWGWQYVFPANALSEDPRGGKSRATMLTPAWSIRPLKQRSGRRGSQKESLPTPFATASPRIFCNGAAISEPSRPCSGIMMFPPP